MEKEKLESVIVVLRPDEYRRLSDIADAQSRAPNQQAAHYVRRALSRQTTTTLQKQEASLT